jgi:sugar transferase (PEP-CTERM/EpsH1 system associated)
VRILLLSPYVPFPPEDGGRVRIYQLLKGLAFSHDVELLALMEETDAESAGVGGLRTSGFAVEGVPHRATQIRAAVRAARGRTSLYQARCHSPGFARALEERLSREHYDIVQCEFAYMAQYHRTSARGPRWVLDEHNLEYRLNATLLTTQSGARGIAYRAYARRELELRRHEELSACRLMDHVLTVSEEDRQALRSELPVLEATVVPNGVDLQHYSPSASDDPEQASAVFVGKMDYRPNVDAVRWFCAEVLPRVRAAVPHFVFTIVGPRPTSAVRELARLPGVRVTGRVADTRPYVRDAAVAVVPIRAGSGTRLKILEALAMGRAVVSTTLGCEGLDTVDGAHLVVADSPRDFADQVIRLLRHGGERARLGRAGRRLMEERYGWAAAVTRLGAVYEQLVGTRASVGAGVR